MEPFPVVPCPIKNVLFPKKLWELVNDVKITAINWNSSGNAIIVRQDLIESQVFLLDVFKATTFLSFVRQLHYYGFRKCKRWSRERPNIHQYSHPNFMRSHPELLSFIKRYPRRQWDKVKSTISTPTTQHLFPKVVNAASTHLNHMPRRPAETYHMGVDPNKHHLNGFINSAKMASPSINGSDTQPLTNKAQSSPVPEAVEEAEDSGPM
ncbi:Heat shock factor protein 5 [Takifugu flavidus]|uniref:Heat shock factor protein 5 n=1 Tax=Takifugu flavidus TaxID=433684 RepID=A0A5C6MMM4_9TELE|nr:Heat shock factor protein 5 [Takifugu flavidus]